MIGISIRESRGRITVMMLFNWVLWAVVTLFGLQASVNEDGHENQIDGYLTLNKVSSISINSEELKELANHYPDLVSGWLGFLALLSIVLAAILNFFASDPESVAEMIPAVGATLPVTSYTDFEEQLHKRDVHRFLHDFQMMHTILLIPIGIILVRLFLQSSGARNGVEEPSISSYDDE